MKLNNEIQILLTDYDNSIPVKIICNSNLAVEKATIELLRKHKKIKAKADSIKESNKSFNDKYDILLKYIVSLIKEKGLSDAEKEAIAIVVKRFVTRGINNTLVFAKQNFPELIKTITKNRIEY